MKLNMKYIIVTGGVISGLGKGITASSIGVLLKCVGLNVAMIKIDPYLNIDAGTMSPYEHGEVFVLQDGTETDLDLGNYERFLNISLTHKHNITTGKIYKSVIEDEREGKYLGKTVQIIPHITDKIQHSIEEAAHTKINGRETDVCIVEVGGTVGDIESMPFIEALRQMAYTKRDDMLFVHVSLVPIIGENNEYKTKPTQNTVKDLRQLGISPHMLILRGNQMVDEATKEKVSLFCQVSKENIISNPNVETIYDVPLIFDDQFVGRKICKSLNLDSKYLLPNCFGDYNCLTLFKDYKKVCRSVNKGITICIAGKYSQSQDAYLSIIRALEHAAYYCKYRIKVKLLSTENIHKDNVDKKIGIYDAIVIPGGFGERGIEGMVTVAKYCRDNNKPVLGICLGMHVMVIEASRRIWGDDCNSTEFVPDTANPVVTIIRNDQQLGGTMKLGSHFTTVIMYKNYKQHTLAYKIYKKEKIVERHRHRYEVNPFYIEMLSQELMCTGVSYTDNCIDIVEDPNNRFYLGCQYHPEFYSSLEKPSPIFLELLESI